MQLVENWRIMALFVGVRFYTSLFVMKGSSLDTDAEIQKKLN